MSKGKIILLAVLGLALVGAIVATVLLLPGQAAEGQKNNLIKVSEINFESIRSIKTAQGGSVLEVERSGDTWRAVGSDAPVDKLTCESMATYLSYVYATAVVEKNPQGLEKYGLNPPELTAELSLTDGNTVKFSFGRATADKSAVYFMKSGDPSLYTMMNEHFAQIKGTMAGIMDISLPALDKDNLASIAYKRGTIEQSLSRSDIAESGFAFDKTGVAAASVFIEQVQKMLGYRLSAYLGTEAKPEYGLDKGDYVKITDKAGKTLNMTLGANTEDKKFYCSIEGKPGVYLAAEDFLSFIVDNTYLGMDWRLIPVPAGNIASISFSGGGKDLTLASENGKYLENGKEVAKADYDRLIAGFTAIQAPGAINTKPEGKAAYSLNVKLTDGKSFKADLLPYLKGFYALDFGKGPYLYIKAEALDFIK